MSDSLGMDALVLPYLNGLKVHLPDVGPARCSSHASLVCACLSDRGQRLLRFPVQVWVSWVAWRWQHAQIKACVP